MSSDIPFYASPPRREKLDEGSVRAALDFLVAIEPVPTAQTREAYEAAIVPYASQVAAAMATIRKFADRRLPMTLEQMQIVYYGFTNDPQYLVSPETSSVVTSVLNAAWSGVGPWRR